MAIDQTVLRIELDNNPKLFDDFAHYVTAVDPFNNLGAMTLPQREMYPHLIRSNNTRFNQLVESYWTNRNAQAESIHQRDHGANFPTYRETVAGIRGNPTLRQQFSAYLRSDNPSLYPNDGAVQLLISTNPDRLQGETSRYWVHRNDDIRGVIGRPPPGPTPRPAGPGPSIRDLAKKVAVGGLLSLSAATVGVFGYELSVSNQPGTAAGKAAPLVILTTIGWMAYAQPNRSRNP